MSWSGTVSPGINFKRYDSSSIEDVHSECEGSAIIPILGSFSGSGFATFQDALIARLGEAWLNTTVPENYTVAGWNGTGSWSYSKDN
jgi:sphingomyelin phosphodiesterase